MDGATIGIILGALGTVIGWIRGGRTKQVAASAGDALRGAVMAELDHVLLDDPDGSAGVAESLLRDAATAAANRLHLPSRIARPLVRLAVQAGMTELRRRLAQARAARELPARLEQLHDSARDVLTAMDAARARGEAEGRRMFEGVEVEIIAPGASGEASGHASGSADNGGGSEPPPAPLLSGTRER